MNVISSWKLVRTCGAIGILCSLWNLYGDIYYMDFFTAHMDNDLNKILPVLKNSGYLFQFNKDDDANPLLFGILAQAGGWMYPIWALVTVVPIFVGLEQQKHRQDDGIKRQHSIFWSRMAPCALLAYGYCII